MKLKKVLSGFLSAAILATTTAIVMPVEASAVTGNETVSYINVKGNSKSWALQPNYECKTMIQKGTNEYELSFTNTASYDDSFDGGALEVNFYDVEGESLSDAKIVSVSVANNDKDVSGTATAAQSLWDGAISGNGAETGFKYTFSEEELTKIGSVAQGESVNIKVSVTYTAPPPTVERTGVGTYGYTSAAKGEDSSTDENNATAPRQIKMDLSELLPNGKTAADIRKITTTMTATGGKAGGRTGLNVEGTWTAGDFDENGVSTIVSPKGVDSDQLILQIDWINYSTTLNFVVEVVCDVPVESVAISGTDVANKKLSLEKGKDATLTATVTPDEASAEDKAVTWAVSSAEPAGCVTVDADGKVTAVAAGKATVTATTAGKDADGKAVSDSVEVTVTPLAEAVEITSTVTTVLVGDTTTKLTAKLIPDGTADTTPIVWKSSDENILKIAEDGTLTAVAVGEATIAAYAGSFTPATVIITVTDTVTPATGIVLASENLKNGDLALFVGDVENMTATLTPADSTDVVTWTSSDPAIAEVVNGKITAVSEGRTTISATANENVSAHILVTVTKKVIAITGVTLDKETASVEEGKTVTLTATVAPADTTEDKTVTWKSSDETVATVKDGVVTAVKAGTANITATAGGKTATCAVTVTAKAEDPKPSGNALWEGTQDMTWSDSIQIAKEKFADLKAGDTIEITVTKAASGAQISLKSMGEGWPALPAFNKIDPQWGCDNISKADTYKYVMTEDDVKVLKADGMVVGGHDYTVTSVKLVAAAEEPIEKTEYETGKAETVKDYVPKETPAAGTKTELKVNSISTADAAKYSSYDITITVTLKDGTKKTATKSVSDCYKGFTYNNGAANTTVKAAEGFFILVKVKNVPADATVEMSIKGVE